MLSCSKLLSTTGYCQLAGALHRILKSECETPCANSLTADCLVRSLCSVRLTETNVPRFCLVHEKQPVSGQNGAAGRVAHRLCNENGIQAGLVPPIDPFDKHREQGRSLRRFIQSHIMQPNKTESLR